MSNKDWIDELSYKDMSWSEKLRVFYFAITLIALATTEGSMTYELILLANLAVAFILVKNIKPKGDEEEEV